MEDLLCGWTIYRPPEFPQHYAVQQWWATDQGEVLPRTIVVLCGSLDEAREQVPAGAICFPRESADDPVVVETWL